jgi:hypothetical protein
MKIREFSSKISKWRRDPRLPPVMMLILEKKMGRMLAPWKQRYAGSPLAADAKISGEFVSRQSPVKRQRLQTNIRG